MGYQTMTEKIMVKKTIHTYGKDFFWRKKFFEKMSKNFFVKNFLNKKKISRKIIFLISENKGSNYL